MSRSWVFGLGSKEDNVRAEISKHYSKIVSPTINGELEFLDETYSKIKTCLQPEKLHRDDKIFIGISCSSSIANDFVANLLPVALKGISFEKDVRKMMTDIKTNISRDAGKGGWQQMNIPKPGVIENDHAVYMWPVFFETVIPGKRFAILLFNEQTGNETKLSKLQNKCCHVILEAGIKNSVNRTAGSSECTLTVNFADADRKGSDQVCFPRFGDCYRAFDGSASIPVNLVVSYAKLLLATTSRFAERNLKYIENKTSLSGYFRDCITIVNCTVQQNARRESMDYSLDNTNTGRRRSSNISSDSLTSPKLWADIESKVMEWIQVSLSKESLQELEKVFDDILGELTTVSNWKNHMESLEPEFRSRILLCKEWLEKYCESLQGLNKLQDLKQIENSLDSLRDEILCEISQEMTSTLIDQSIQRLSAQFLHQCVTIQNDRFAQKQMIQECLKLYEEIVETSTRDTVIYNATITYDRSIAFLNCIVSLNETFANGRWKIDEDMKKFNYEASTILRSTHSDQLLKLETKWKSLKGVIAKAKSTYDNEIEDFLSSNGNDDDDVINREHKKIFANSKQILQDAIHRDIDREEPTEKHLNSLISKIKLSYNIQHDSESTGRDIAQTGTHDSNKTSQIDKTQPPDGPKIKCLAPSNKNKERLLAPTAPRSSTPAPNACIEYQIVFQLSFSCVKAACISIDTVAKTVSKIHDTKSLGNKIGLANNQEEDQWVCIETENIPDRHMKESWTIQDFLIGFQYEENVACNKKDFKVTADFLLSVIFGAEKARRQLELGKVVEKVAISVPDWFTSYQRQQVYNALFIAGFTQIRIFNESSVVAFYHLKDFQDSSAVVTITENSERSVLSFYSFNSGSRTQTMLSCVDYDEVDLEISEEKAVSMFKSGKTRNEENTKEKMIKFLDMACIRTKRNCKTGELERFPIAFSEDISEQWERFAGWFRPGMIPLKEPVISGLAEISKDMASDTCRKFQEVALFNIVLYESVRGEESIVREMTVIEQPHHPPFVCKLKMRIGEIQFYQSNSAVKVQFGSLNILQCPKDSQDIIIWFKYDDNSIIKLYKIEYSISLLENQNAKELSSDFYKWTDFGLSSDQITFYQKAISTNFGNEDDSRKNQNLVGALIKSLNNIQDAIKIGDGSFKTQMTSDRVLQEIDMHLFELSKPKSANIDIQEAYNYFNQITEKHNLKHLMVSLEQ